jgi:SAM-dependent methyltransferase
VAGRLASLRDDLGDADIYLIDQVLRGRVVETDTVLDAGCGEGRNLECLLRLGCRALAVDRDPDAIETVRRIARQLAPHLPPDNFRVESIETMTFPASAADVVVCSAVLHFADSDEQFEAMLGAMWRVLRPGGLFFCRLATTIGIDHASARPLGGRRWRLGDGSTRYLADQAQLTDALRRMGGQLADPVKTTIVEGQRCMTTWVVRR